MDIIQYGLCHSNLKPFLCVMYVSWLLSVTCDNEPDVYSVLACDSYEVLLCEKFYILQYFTMKRSKSNNKVVTFKIPLP